MDTNAANSINSNNPENAGATDVTNSKETGNNVEDKAQATTRSEAPPAHPTPQKLNPSVTPGHMGENHQDAGATPTGGV